MGAKKGEVPRKGGPPLDEVFRDTILSGTRNDTVIVFVPSHTRNKVALPDQDVWAAEALNLMGELFGGATAFRNLVGTWRDDDNKGQLVEDTPIMIQSLVQRVDIEDVRKVSCLGDFLKRMGRETKQGAVGVVFNDTIHFISNYE